jgi:hypothetical protein
MSCAWHVIMLLIMLLIMINDYYELCLSYDDQSFWTCTCGTQEERSEAKHVAVSYLNALAAKIAKLECLLECAVDLVKSCILPF